MLRREQGGGKAGLPKKGSMGPSTLERSNHSLYLSHSCKRSVVMWGKTEGEDLWAMAMEVP